VLESFDKGTRKYEQPSDDSTPEVVPSKKHILRTTVTPGKLSYLLSYDIRRLAI